jgi:chromosomal replication initiation ATPase DnaA
MNSRGQLVFPFRVAPALTPENFVQAPCNEQALQFIRRWPDWPARAAALYGPTGCGKTHLAAVWSRMANAQTIAARDLSAAEPGSMAVIVEDIDSNTPDAACDRALLALFERPGAWLLLTGRAPPGEWPSAIGDLTSRFQSLIGFGIWAPDDALLSGLVAKHFADRQLEVPTAVISRIVTHVERTPAAIAAFVARVDEKALAAKRAITERLVLELLDAEGPS